MSKDLKKTIKETKQQLEVLEKQLEEAEKAKGLWRPAKEDTFFVIGINGEPSEVQPSDFASEVRHSGFNNVFKSRSVAEKAAKLMRKSNLVISACLQVDPDYDDRSLGKYGTARNCVAGVSTRKKAEEVDKIIQAEDAQHKQQGGLV